MVSSTGHGHASLKRVHYASGRFAVANIVTACEVRNPAVCSTRFLHIYLQHYKDDLIVPRMKGTANVSLSLRELAQIPVRLPRVREQLRIVDLIGAVDDAIDSADIETASIKSAAATLRRMIFDELMNTFPESTAGQLFEVTLGRQKSARQLHGDNEIPYIRAANISDGSLSLSDVQSMNFSPEEQSKYGLYDGDVLVVEGGSIGQTAIWRGEVQGPVGFDKHVLRIRGLKDTSTSLYANQWARWCYETGRFEAQARGVTIKALGFQRAKAMAVPSAPFARQIEVAELLSSADAAAEFSLESANSLRTLRAELLSTLLSGTHRIPETYDGLAEV
ncbi:Restriction endonuclease S subunit [Arthrobacter cupressi]|uniref:Restriction endonuclease S subunit n=2 Tax=Arthrobacter cupressi TaxID=1045773 RepID=A0A1G8SQS0_9MICC|nr:Restriction endonuclease S subunit [Arthrobacter cupressi]